MTGDALARAMQCLPSPMHGARKRSETLGRYAALAVLAVLVVTCATPAVEPVAPAPAAEKSAVFAELLERYVDVAGNVDYAAWKATPEDVATLDRYLEALKASPPADEADPAVQLSYWIDLYNALVLREILRRWPIASVFDVGDDSDTPGVSARGFFHDLVFDIGDAKMSLLDIETEIIARRFDDPRAHFALHCGTRSCPLLPRTPLSGASLERGLDQASRAFVNHGERVFVDHDQRRIAISPVFGWYQQDFIDFVKRRTDVAKPTIVDFLLMYADPPLARALRSAREAGYAVALLPYDWRLNQIGAPDTPVESAGATGEAVEPTPIPAWSFQTLDGGAWNPADARGKVLLVDFWATWCRPCLLSFPHYARLQLEHERQGLVVVAVAEDESSAPVKAFAAAHRLIIPIVLDPENAAAEAPLSVTTLPTVLLVDRRGMVRYRHEGYSQPDVERLEAQIEELLAEPAPPPR